MLEVFFDNFFKKEPEGELKIIKRCPVFSKLTQKELFFVKDLLHKRMYSAGEIVFKPSSGTGMYLIVKGRINIFQGSLNSKESPNLISSLKEGDFFGELSLIHNFSYRNTFAQSDSKSQLLGFFQPDLQMITDGHVLIGIKILKQLCEILSHRLQKAEQKILQQVHSS